MIVRCPQCRKEFRLVDFRIQDKVVRYLCPGCNDIVAVDLEMDEIESSSSSGSFRQMDRPHTVLIADDAPEILESSRRLLEEEGFSVLLASDGVDALRMIREQHPDLVVLDLLMPRMTGFDVLREIRKDERIKDTRVLAVSGVYKENILEFLQQLGALGFIEKANLKDSLVFRVKTLFENF